MLLKNFAQMINGSFRYEEKGGNKMVRNLIELSFWCAAIAVTVGLYMNAVADAESQTVASHDLATQLVKND